MLLLVYAADGKQVLLADALVDARVDHASAISKAPKIRPRSSSA